MNADEFRQRAKEMVDYVADYLENIRDRRPMSNVQPGYLRELIPDEAPTQAEKWEDVFADIERVIMPGVTHWHSPNFHAYFASANTYPAICADILSDAIGCVGFTWAASPACTELEMVVMDWLGKLINLPEQFLFGGKGGGVIQGTASEATLVALLAARSKTLKKHKELDADCSDEAIYISKLVAYCSDQAHCSVLRTCLLGAVRCHKVSSDSRDAMRGEALEAVIRKDIDDGLIPFFCCATLGTTASCAFDNLQEIGPVCEKFDIWLHIDAAYAGAAFICPEFRPLLDGVEFAQSYNFNPHKWLLVNFDCSALWFRNCEFFVEAFNVDSLILQHGHRDKTIDYRHFCIPLGRRFRSLKLWFVLRLYGLEGLQKHIRKHVSLAKEFEELLSNDSRFVITNEVKLGLVCFRIKNSTNELNKELLQRINDDGRIHLVPSESKGIYFIRFAICTSRTESSDISFAWSVIQEISDKLLGCRSVISANGLDS